MQQLRSSRLRWLRRDAGKHISNHRVRGALRSLDQPSQHVTNDDSSSFIDKELRFRRTHSTCATSDKCDFAFKTRFSHEGIVLADFTKPLVNDPGLVIRPNLQNQSCRHYYQQ